MGGRRLELVARDQLGSEASPELATPVHQAVASAAGTALVAAVFPAEPHQEELAVRSPSAEEQAQPQRLEASRAAEAAERQTLGELEARPEAQDRAPRVCPHALPL